MSCSFLVIIGSHFKNTVFFWRISFFIYFGLHVHILLLFYIFYIFIFYFIMFLWASSCCDANKNLLSRHLLLQSQQWKHSKKVRNLLKVNNKDIRTSCLLDSYTVWEVCKYEFFLVRIFLYSDQKSVHAVFL